MTWNGGLLLCLLKIASVVFLGGNFVFFQEASLVGMADLPFWPSGAGSKGLHEEQNCTTYLLAEQS